ncbi:hypothetical protein LTR37_005665 [Vermiconidia calcicola]|uniref:Uncharacterized protein n=1 Tax=Vermiconidia calcicola TaxID=1690605 RepID=A0ACC3NIB6_9PEZI|nr:hypothetical protein LTR37_005665 [Vermiconidia calcicola]
MDQIIEVLKTRLALLSERELFSDLTITCGSYRFSVHQVVLYLHTDYFQPLKGFKEGDSQTIALKAIGTDDEDDDVANDDPEAVRLMVDFFYHLDYKADLGDEDFTDKIPTITAEPPSGKKNKRKGIQPPSYQMVKEYGDLLLHAKVFAAAVKYQVPALKALAASKFKHAVNANWNHPTFADAVHNVYTTTPQEVVELRDIVADALNTHSDLLEKAEIETVVLDIPRLAFDLMKKAKGHKNVNPSSCQACGSTRIICSCGAEVCSNCNYYVHAGFCFR